MDKKKHTIIDEGQACVLGYGYTGMDPVVKYLPTLIIGHALLIPSQYATLPKPSQSKRLRTRHGGLIKTVRYKGGATRIVEG